MQNIDVYEGYVFAIAALTAILALIFVVKAKAKKYEYNLCRQRNNLS